MSELHSPRRRRGRVGVGTLIVVTGILVLLVILAGVAVAILGAL